MSNFIYHNPKPGSHLKYLLYAIAGAATIVLCLLLIGLFAYLGITENR